ncbi:MAG TPA: hypothetical protein VNV66_07170 [Pilimelia sp.]|nr:hypothetical protein [Pilimelia sp.]
MPIVEVDAATDRYLAFAAQLAGVSKGAVIAQMIERMRAAEPSERPTELMIYADYAGHRTHGVFVPGPGRVEITSGPLAGSSYKTPSEAARAVVAQYNPTVSPHRNGWTFWSLESSGQPLQTVRHHH